MFNNNNESNDDDDFFITTSSSSSNLANLFGTGYTGVQDLKSSLKYIPQKQPKSNQQVSQQKKQLICMKTITLGQFIASKFSTIGKFGIALIGDVISTDLIIYKTKENILSSSKLTSNFQYKQVNELSITFIDDQSLAWMITFNNNQDKMEFVGELERQGAKAEEQTQEFAQSNSTNENYSQRLVAEKPEEDKTRADILGRISKMGLSILPTTESPSSSPANSNLTTPTSYVNREFSESEPEELVRTTKLRKVRSRHSESAIEKIDLISKSAGSSQFVSFPNNLQHVSLNHHQLMDPLNIYFTENRTHNSEVRMNLLQLGNKIDCLLNEIRPQAVLNNSEDNKFLEKRIVELERRLEHYSSTPSTYNCEVERKLEQLTKENAQNVLKYDQIITALRNEQSGLRSDLEAERKSKENNKIAYSEDLLKLEQENQQLKQTILEMQVKITEAVPESIQLPDLNNIQFESNKTIELQQVKISELEAVVENQRVKLNEMEVILMQHKECEHERLKYESIERDQTLKCEFLQQSINELNNKLAEIQLKYDQLLEYKCKGQEVFSDMVKDTMNTMYQNVLSESLSGPNFDAKDLKKCLQKYMKTTTFAIIDQYNNYDKAGSSVSHEFEVTV